MDFINDLGAYGDIASVWRDYPNGGLAGDYVTVHGIRYGWNRFTHQWATDDIVNSAGVQTRRVDGSLSVARDVYVGGVLYCRGVKYRCKGLYASADALRTAWPVPEPGDWAIVGETVPGEIYLCKEPGVWVATGQAGGGEKVDLTEYARKSELKEACDGVLALVNGMYANMGIVKSYHSYADMVADRHPKNNHGEPLKEGAQAVVHGKGRGHNRVYRWNDPGWTYLYTIDTPDLGAVWDMIYKLHASVGLSASPSMIEKGVPNTITLEWSVMIGEELIEDIRGIVLEEDGVELPVADAAQGTLEREGVKDSRLYELSAELPYGGTKRATARVAAYYPVYIGSSGKEAEALTPADILSFAKQGIRANPSGTYTMTVANDTEYIYICVPEGMAVTKALMGGMPMVLRPAVSVAVDGKGGYLVYRSEWSQDAGRKTFTLEGTGTAPA